MAGAEGSWCIPKGIEKSHALHSSDLLPFLVARNPSLLSSLRVGEKRAATTVLAHGWVGVVLGLLAEVPWGVLCALSLHPTQPPALCG